MKHGISKGDKQTDQQRMHKRMMIAVPRHPHGLTVLTQTVRCHNTRKIIKEPGQPAGDQQKKQKQLSLQRKCRLRRIRHHRNRRNTQGTPFQIQQEKAAPPVEQENNPAPVISR